MYLVLGRYFIPVSPVNAWIFDLAWVSTKDTVACSHGGCGRIIAQNSMAL